MKNSIDLSKKKIVLPKSKVIPKKETTTVDEKSIQLPSDFDSLHDIKDFGKTYKQVISFIDNIKEFQNEYLHSMLKTWDEVLLYIPENQLPSYKVYLQDHCLCEWKDLELGTIQKQIQDPLRNERIYHRRHYNIELIGIIGIHDKTFLIDTVNKKIQLCLWYRNRCRDTIQGWLYNHFCNVEYTRGYTFDILPDEDIFRIVVNLSRKSILNPEKYQEVAKEARKFGNYDFPYRLGNNGGFEIYDFCMRTNTFKGYNEKESYHSSWSYRANRTFKY